MIYLDNAATTRPDEEALEIAERYYKENYFNPSALYAGGLEVKKKIAEVKSKILSVFPTGYDMIFTSCGSESDNMAVSSFAKRGNIVTTEGEHSAIYECFNELKKRGVETRFAKLNPDGGVNVDSLLSLVDEKTSVVSVVRVNNETGAINDVNEIAGRVKKINQSTVFHSDGVQAFGKLPTAISDKVDLYSISAHKIGGLKGTGGLVFKKSVRLVPLIFGGGQENGLRSGTENVFGIIDFGAAAYKRLERISENYSKIAELKQIFLDNLDKRFIKIISGENASPYILSLSAVGLRGEVILHMLEEFGIIVGTGSACSSRMRHSRVLKACGYNAGVLDGAIRISFGVDNTKDEVIFAAEKLGECVNKLKGVMDRR